MRNSSNSEIDKEFCFNLVTTKEIKQLRQSLNAKKAVGIDLIPPKLVKLADIPFYKPLTETINFCIQHGIYPDSAKVALAVHLNTENPKKIETPNFKPFITLNTISKIYELVIKNQIVTDTEKGIVLSMSSLNQFKIRERSLIKILQ